MVNFFKSIKKEIEGAIDKGDAEREFDNLDVGTAELWEMKRRQHNNVLCGQQLKLL